MLRRTSFVLALALLVRFVPASATAVLALDVDALTQRADRVVRARVVSAASRWDAKHERIHTFTTLEVLDDLAGQGPRTIVVRQLGGTVDGVSSRVEGDAVLVPGEEVVVFLRKNPNGEPVMHLIGLAQGCFRIQRDEGQAPVAVRDLADLSLVSRSGPSTLAQEKPGPVRIDLSTLEARIEAAALR